MTAKDYKDFILERLDDMNIFNRAMMGGYLFYYDNTLFGGIYENNNFLIKKTDSNLKYGLKEEVPYKGGKTMYLIEDLENVETLKNIIIDTCADLAEKK